MKILAFDTSSIACSVALLNGKEITATHQVAPMQQAQLILPTIQALLSAASLTLDQLDAIAFGCGPGSFTGIRIASSVAQGLGFATQLPIIRISSLAALAQATYEEQQWDRLLIAVDAHMDHVYWAMYTVNTVDKLVKLEGAEQTSLPEEVVLPPQGVWYGAGDGWQKYPDRLTQRLGYKPQIAPAQRPTAQALIKLAAASFARGEWVTVADAVPDYLLSPVKIQNCNE